MGLTLFPNLSKIRKLSIISVVTWDDYRLFETQLMPVLVLNMHI